MGECWFQPVAWVFRKAVLAPLPRVRRARVQLRDKVAVITGAGAGIGRACCLLFAAEGAKVVAIDLEPATLSSVVEDVRRIGGPILAIQADVSRAADVERVVSAASERFATVHIL